MTRAALASATLLPGPSTGVGASAVGEHDPAREHGIDSVRRSVRSSLRGEAPKRAWSSGSLFVDLLPSRDLGNSSFVVGDRRAGTAAVIDPTRDAGRYLERIDRAGLSLAWVLDTHLHSDFVSGGAELAELTGAKLGIGALAETAVAHRPLHDRETVGLGSAQITVLSSPGHTPEHVSYLLSGGDDGASLLFSGGSLMVGSAGRPDLLGPRETYRLAREEFATLHQRYARLPPGLTVLPTHGGGSSCGIGTGSAVMTTLGQERRTNPLLRARDRTAFLAAYLSGHPFPRYYATDRRINGSGAPPIGREIPALPGLSAGDVDRLRSTAGVTVVDLRQPRTFARGHVPGSLSIPLGGPFASWVGWLRPAEEELVLVDDDPRSRREAQIALLRIGYDRQKGYLEGGVSAYARSGAPLRSTPRVTLRSLRRIIERGTPLTLLDVRESSEAALDLLPGAVNIPLPDLPEQARSRLDPSLPLYVHCQSGWRAGIAASVLEQLGFPQVRHVVDGPEAWERPRASIPGSGSG